jgi:hypothetical protein
MPISNLLASVGNSRLPPQTPGRGRHLRRDAGGRTVTSFRPVCRRGLKAIRTITAPGPDRPSTASLLCPGLARLGPKRTGRVSPLWRGTSDLNFPDNLLRRHHCSLNSDGTGSPVSLSRTIARSTVMPFRRTTSQPRSSLSTARSNVAKSGPAPSPKGWSGSSRRPWFS